LFKLNTDGSGFAVVHIFDAATDGCRPRALMRGTDGVLYGTTLSGGPLAPDPDAGFGTVFKVNTDGSGFTVLHDFYGPVDGSSSGKLAQGPDGALYGANTAGGSGDYGTLFKLNTDGSGFTVLKSFTNDSTGGSPFCTLLWGTDGNLYGTAATGGNKFRFPTTYGDTTIVNYSPGSGTVFRLVFDQANQPPVATITGPASGAVFPVNTPVSFTGNWTDTNGGAHTAQWAFDGTPDASSPAGTGTSGAANTSHAFTAAGVYMVQLTITDDFGATGTATQVGGVDAMVVVYDPNAGFVTGGGWIDSPAGAYVANPSLIGKANFGFVSKYKKGQSVPTGETEFQFKVGNLSFYSASYDWLVVSGARALYKGTGTINNAGSYKFMLTAIDGQIPGGGGRDKFRMKITDASGGALVYDNLLNAPDSSDPTTLLGAGSIVIQTNPASPAVNEPREEAPTTPVEYDLAQNYPNPFDRNSQIAFSLAERSRISLVIYDLAGRAVQTLAEGEWGPGPHIAIMSRSGSDGRTLEAGIYFVRMRAQSVESDRSFTSRRSVVVVK